VDGDGRLLYRLPGHNGPVWVEVKPVSLSRQADNAAYYDAARLVTVARTRSGCCARGGCCAAAAHTRSDAAAG
jgi:hypothetical protein